MLTRNSLKALGIESEKIDAIIDGHVETVTGLKGKADELQAELDKAKSAMSERDKFKADLEKAQERIAKLEAKTANSGDVEAERDQLKTEVESLRAEVDKFTTEREASNTELTSLREQVASFETEKATLTESASKAQKELEEFKTHVETERTNSAKRDAVRTALRANGVARPEFQDLILNSMNLDEVNIGEGGIENVDALMESTKTKYPGCFSSVTVEGTPTVNPPSGNPPRPLTVDDVRKMSPDEINAHWDEVKKALANG